MTYVADSVKNVERIVAPKAGILSRMTRTTSGKYQRLAGTRFTYLIRQLQEEDEKRWTIQAIADAIGCDRSLVSIWAPGRVRHGGKPADRSGLTDLVITGIHDGLGISSEYLFMSSKGLPDHVLLRDGTKRPCGPEELDHKLFKFEEEKLKILVKRQEQRQADQQAEMTAMRSEMTEMRVENSEMRAMLRELLGSAKHVKRT